MTCLWLGGGGGFLFLLLGNPGHELNAGLERNTLHKMIHENQGGYKEMSSILLTNSALVRVYEPKCGGERGSCQEDFGGVAGS